MSRSRSLLRAAAALAYASMALASACATSRPASAPMALVSSASSASPKACARPMVLAQNLTREPISLYKGSERRQSFVAEVAPGGAYSQQAEPGVGYFVRAGRGRGTHILGQSTDAGAAGMVRVEMKCADR